jgi:hypothetical protein
VDRIAATFVPDKHKMEVHGFGSLKTESKATLNDGRGCHVRVACTELCAPPDRLPSSMRGRTMNVRLGSARTREHPSAGKRCAHNLAQPAFAINISPADQVAFPRVWGGIAMSRHTSPARNDSDCHAGHREGPHA